MLDTNNLKSPFADSPVEKAAPELAGRSLRLMRESRKDE
jgi:hypothetical protein